MIVLVDNLPMEGQEGDGSIQFTHEGFMYHIGTLEDSIWISRQTVEDYESGEDNYEKIERWVLESRRDIKLGR